MPKKMSEKEKVVLIGICKFIVNSDGIVTGSELETMEKIAEELGFNDYQESFNQADNLITSEGVLKDEIELLKGSGNCRKILKYAVQLSRADAFINTEKMDILVYAADMWDIDVKSLLK